MSVKDVGVVVLITTVTLIPIPIFVEDSVEASHEEAIHERFIPTSTAFWTRDRGLVGGYLYDQDYCETRCRGVIAIARKGGRDLRVVHRTRRARVVHNITLAPQGHAWAEVDCFNPARCRTILLHSSDRGRSWKAVSKTPVEDVSFIDARRAWGVGTSWKDPANAGDQTGGYRVVVMRTTDGGRSWHRLARPCKYEHQYTSVSRVSRRKGWIACGLEPGAGEQWKEIRRTGDGGQTWRRKTNPPRRGYLDEIFFLRGGRGWLWGPRYTVSKTRDGAETWRGLSFFEPDEDFVESMWFINARRGYAVAWAYDSDSNRVYRLLTSRDGGRSWRVRQTWH